MKFNGAGEPLTNGCDGVYSPVGVPVTEYTPSYYGKPFSPFRDAFKSLIPLCPDYWGGVTASVFLLSNANIGIIWLISKFK